ncbi:MAG: FG-GAP-like repeat-containing protein [Gammaproteobacteria bacterium]
MNTLTQRAKAQTGAGRPHVISPLFRRRVVAAAVRRALLAGVLATQVLPAWADTSKLIFNNPDELTQVVGSKPVLVDIDGDGKLDIFVGTNAGTILYFQNIGTNSKPQYVERTGAANPLNGVNVSGRAAPAFVDIDGDGDYDMVLGAIDGSLSFYLNTGTKTAPVFVQQTGASNPFNGVSVGTRSAPVFVDLDGDGDYDALVGAYDGTIRYFENTGTANNPVFTQRTGALNPFNGVDIGFSSEPAVVDIDADGDFDVFIGNKTGSIFYYENTGTRSSPVFTNRTGAANPLNGIRSSSDSTPTFGDINGDGTFDVLIGAATGPVQVVTNSGSASGPLFKRVNPLTGINAQVSRTPVFVDIDGDGAFDAFIGNQAGRVDYYKNVGTNLNPQFVQQTGTANPLDGVSVGTLSTVAFVDIDGDGDYDAFVGAGDGTIHFFKNTGTATSPLFTELTGSANPLNGVNVGARAAPAFVDIDGNGVFDVCIGASDGTLHFYRNTGTATSPTFVSVTGAGDPFNGITVGSNSKPAFADIDWDGDFDLVVGAGTGLLRVFENTGNRFAPTFTERTGTNNPLAAVNVLKDSAPALVDIDGDGDIDLFVGAYNSTIFKYFRNDTLFADLAITQSATPNPALLQNPTDLRLTVTNLGRDTATGAIVTDTLPAGVTFVSATSDDGGSCSPSGGVVTCLLNNMIRNAVVHVDIQVRPTSLATMSNTASVTANELDSIQSNNQTSASVNVIPVADLGVSVVPSPSPVYAGTNLSYAITLRNQGPSPATGVTLSDVLPGGVVLLSATSTAGTCSTSGLTITCNLNDLPAGSSELVTLLTRPGVAGLLTNTLSARANETDLNPADNTASATVTVNPAADVGVSIVPSPNPVYAGTNLSYAITLLNQGPSPATGVTLSDVLPGGVGLLSATSTTGTCSTPGLTITCNLNDLPAGGSEFVTLLTRPGVAGLLTNTLSARANETDLNPADNTASATVTVTAAADIGVSIQSVSSLALAGTNLTYAVTLRNQGPSTATGVTLSDVLPSGVTLISATTGAGVCSAGGATITCAMNDLSMGGAEVVTLITRPGSAGSVANTVSITANETDLKPADNSAVETVAVHPAPAFLTGGSGALEFWSLSALLGAVTRRLAKRSSPNHALLPRPPHER